MCAMKVKKESLLCCCGQSKMFLAKALYDNVAETPDEVPFVRGDVLTVLDTEANGCEGWWRCRLRGKVGMVPGNRLKVIQGTAGAQNGGDPSNGNVETGPATPKKVGNHLLQRTGGKSRIVSILPPEHTSPRGLPSLPSLPSTRGGYPTHPHAHTAPSTGVSSLYHQAPSSDSTYDVPRPSKHVMGSASPRGSESFSSYSFDGPESDYDMPRKQSTPVKSMGDFSNSNSPIKSSYIGSPRLMSMDVSVDESDYDTPRNRGMGSRDSTYDYPPSMSAAMLSVDLHSTPGSNRSSTISMLSTGSSAMSSASASASGSAGHGGRASMDITADDVYDFPPAPRCLSKTPGDGKRECPSQFRTSGDMLESLEDYDTPRKHKHLGDVRTCSVVTEGDYDVPRKHLDALSAVREDLLQQEKLAWRKSEGSADSGTDQTYDILPPSSHPITKDVETDDVYDIPKKAAMSLTPPSVGAAKPPIGSSPRLPKKQSHRDIQSIYDVPPQVTRDNALGMVNTSVDRSSSCSTDSQGSDVGSVEYEVLRLSLHAALESLAKLHQAIQTSMSRFLGHVSGHWRSHGHVSEAKMFDIKTACGAVHVALREMVEFNQGVMANAVQGEDKKLARDVHRQLEWLQVSLRTITKHMQNLDGMQWKLASLQQQQQDTDTLSDQDDLEVIVQFVKMIPEKSHLLANTVQNNAAALFRQPQTPTPATHAAGGEASPTAGNTPILRGKPPPPLKPKPQLTKEQKSSLVRTSTVQDRPLPSLPKEKGDGDTSDTDNVYDFPKTHKESTPDNVYDNNKKEAGEYDYVSLTKNASVLDQSLCLDKLSQSPVSVNTSCENQQDVYDKVPSSRQPLVTESELVPPKLRTSGLSPMFREKLEMLQAEAEQPVEIHSTESDYDTPQSLLNSSTPQRSKQNSSLHEHDRQILGFYAAQMQTHACALRNAIEAFQHCIECNQPPKVFIAHSKFVVLAAHKLVYIGDTITRNVLHEEIRNQVMQNANHLCEVLKLTVTATKQAALQFPSIPAQKLMVDRVGNVSDSAANLQMTVTESVRPA